MTPLTQRQIHELAKLYLSWKASLDAYFFCVPGVEKEVRRLENPIVRRAGRPKKVDDPDKLVVFDAVMGQWRKNGATIAEIAGRLGCSDRYANKLISAFEKRRAEGNKKSCPRTKFR